MKLSRPSGRRVGVICLLAVLVALPTIVMGPLRQSSDTSADAASYAEAGPQIRRLYLAYFQREPDPTGWPFWLQHRAEGRSLIWVSDRFAESQEFQERYGNLSNDDFVRLVYRNALGRAPDPTGWEGWRAALRGGASRGHVMVGFSESQEFIARTKPATSGPAASPAPSNPAPTPPPPPPPPPSNPAPPPPAGQAPGTGGGGLANVSSGLNVNNHLMPVWQPAWEDGYPAFRTFCEFSHLGYYDPIVYPGGANASHLHAFFGNTLANASSTYASLRTSGNSTCDGGPMNRTAYWMPAAFDGSGQVVVPSSIEVYYKSENAPSPNQVSEFPNGLRMIAGAPGPAGTYGWGCGSLSYNKEITNCDGSRLTATVRFPYCWDGKNLDSADHRSHMAYGVDNTWGRCPSSHPVHLPEVTELFHWNNPSGTSNWYLSSDRAGMITPAPDGSTLHADWFGAWEDSVESTWVQHCLRLNRSASNGKLCDGTQLSQVANYNGPARLSGWRPQF